MEQLPELVRDTKLTAAYGVIHNFVENPRPEGSPRLEVWQRQRRLGKGDIDQVWLEKCVQGQMPGHPELRAVKVVTVDENNQLKKYARELEATAKFSQKKYATHFVQSFGWYQLDHEIFIPLEYLPFGDLGAYMLERRRVPEEDTKEISRQVLQGLNIMHQEGFSHRDLKPDNIMIRSCPPDPWWVKLCDFGLSKRINATKMSSALEGIEGFIAPDIVMKFRKRIYGPEDEEEDSTESSRKVWFAADVWSFGETVARMLSGGPTFGSGPQIMEYFQGSQEFPKAALQERGCSELATDFLQNAMKAQWDLRLTAQSGLEHSWLVATEMC